MKTKAFLVAALLAPLSAQADPTGPIPGASANVTVMLTASYTHEVINNPNSEVTKIVAARYSNKELLSDLLAEGYLTDGILAGWKLIIVDRTPLLSNDHNTLVFYAVKTGKAPVLIPSARFGLDVNTDVSAEAVNHTFSGDTLTATKDRFKAILDITGRQQLGGPNPYDNSFTLRGIATGSSASSLRSIKRGDVTTSFTFNLLGAAKLSPIIGVVTDNLSTQENPDRNPVEGSITFSAFVPLDLTDYPPDNS